MFTVLVVCYLVSGIFHRGAFVSVCVYSSFGQVTSVFLLSS